MKKDDNKWMGKPVKMNDTTRTGIVSWESKDFIRIDFQFGMKFSKNRCTILEGKTDVRYSRATITVNKTELKEKVVEHKFSRIAEFFKEGHVGFVEGKTGGEYEYKVIEQGKKWQLTKLPSKAKRVMLEAEESKRESRKEKKSIRTIADLIQEAQYAQINLRGEPLYADLVDEN